MLRAATAGRAGGLIAHRGASGYRPENTIAAYELAVELGVESLELDVVPTSDGQLVTRHESELSKTTDVATRGEFTDRRTTKVIDHKLRTGWFTEDFTLVELRQLRTKERMRATRTGNHRFDGHYPVPTLEEVVAWASRTRTRSGRRVGLYVEIKHSTYFSSIGLPLEEEVVRVLRGNGYGDAGAPVWIESAEVTNLRALAGAGPFNLIQLVHAKGRPEDLRVSGDGRSYADLVTKRGLREIRGYAGAVGLAKELAIPRDAQGRLLRPSPVIRYAHSLDLAVLGWTFRRENRYLPAEFQVGSDPYGPGDLAGELQVFDAAGMDGMFTDNPDVTPGDPHRGGPRHGSPARLWGRLRRRGPG